MEASLYFIPGSIAVDVGTTSPAGSVALAVVAGWSEVDLLKGASVVSAVVDLGSPVVKLVVGDTETDVVVLVVWRSCVVDIVVHITVVVGASVEGIVVGEGTVGMSVGSTIDLDYV